MVRSGRDIVSWVHIVIAVMRLCQTVQIIRTYFLTIFSYNSTMLSMKETMAFLKLESMRNDTKVSNQVRSVQKKKSSVMGAVFTLVFSHNHEAVRCYFRIIRETMHSRPSDRRVYHTLFAVINFICLVLLIRILQNAFSFQSSSCFFQGPGLNAVHG